MLATIPSATLLGVEGRPVRVEVHVSNGLPGFTIVGLPDTSCREARDRVRSALLSSGLAWPDRRITVNLAPTSVRKAGAVFDLAIAVGILAASEQVPPDSVDQLGFLGELGLDGSVRPVPGMVSLADAAPAKALVVPGARAHEATLVRTGPVHAVDALGEVVAALAGDEPWPEPASGPAGDPLPALPDLADVRGQPTARRALEVAAAGGHHLLMVGPPGAGKTMLANRLVGLLPELRGAEAVEATRIHSAAGLPLPPGGLVTRPPFRAPHHGASLVALTGGGGGPMRPGEVSAATHGVLFLDEMGQFAPSVLDALREPLEEGVIRVSRARASVTYPASFLLVGALNPCPCGQGGPPGSCRCTDGERARYVRRLSGPLVDRFDIRLDVPRPDVADLLSRAKGEPTAVVAARVATARRIAAERDVRCNAAIPASRLDEIAVADAEATSLLEMALRNGRLTARGLGRVLRVARTVADLAEHEGDLSAQQVGVALQLRADLAGLVGLTRG